MNIPLFKLLCLNNKFIVLIKDIENRNSLLNIDHLRH